MTTKTIKKIEYYDLREEVERGKILELIGRQEEVHRISRVTNRSLRNNIMIIGPRGIGKTTLFYGWVKNAIQNKKNENTQYIQFDTEHLYDLENNEDQRITITKILERIPHSVIFIDNFGKAVYKNNYLIQNIERVYNNLLKNQNPSIVLCLESREYSWLEKEYPAFVELFETIQLKNQTKDDYVKILRNTLPKINQKHRVIIPTISLEDIVSYTERFPNLGQLPQSAISLLDESIALASANGKKALFEETISEVISSKTGIPINQLNADEIEILKNLEEVLNKKIINQESSIQLISKTLQRAKLGLRNPNKPLGSFLMMGPSGVGKTETAKLIAEYMFGKSESFIRFDMSEFGQEHTVQRLIGAPAGYSGYESGGALTNALKKEPHCLILLDEIEKAHPKVFDIFLQLLDDGRITSGQNETVDAKNCIVMATSNAGVKEILKEFFENEGKIPEDFVKERIIPALEKSFRLEFINRFDNLLVFNPLTQESLLQIAKLEIEKIEKRLIKHKVKFDIDTNTLEEKIKGLADPRFGARPVKRFIEETCESLMVQSLLNEKK
ncbi:MAG: AAA family ATPase [Candidatus Pacebacteria bacterium]|nr:AAA family ATPase [Candidatus Paceibacterota bacterium]MCF7862744.1 AAA family ATPase [Candidatus Paceibacterota bacterium]